MNLNQDIKPSLSNLNASAEGGETQQRQATASQPLSDFLQQLEDYVPTVSTFFSYFLIHTLTVRQYKCP